jgi:periplasmic protein TonB
VDIGNIYIFFTVNLDQNARVIGTPTIDKITGLNASNKNQEGLLKSCAIQAIKAASPYNLDSRDYEFWKVQRIKFNARN